MLTFRVLEEATEAPIVGARLRTYEDSVVGTWTTDERGQCVVTVPGPYNDFRLHVEADGFAHLAFDEWGVEGPEFHLARATTLHGRLLAADAGAPLPGASVALAHDGCEAATAVAAPDGGYELAGVPLRQETKVVLRAPGFAVEERSFELRSDEPRIEQDFLLQRGVEIHGRVEDWTSGAGIAGAHVGRIETDADGRFRGRVLPDAGASDVVVQVMAEDHCTLMARLTHAWLDEPLIFRLPRSAIVEGVVRDETGRPIAGAWVSLHVDREELHRRRMQGIEPEPTPLQLPDRWYSSREERLGARTDADGRFRIANPLPWSRTLRLVAGAKGYAGAQQRIESLGGPDEVTRIEIVLAPEEHVPEGLVHGRVQLNGANLRAARGRVRWKGPTRSGEEGLSDGQFVLHVEPGQLELEVELDDLAAPLDRAQLVVAVSDGEAKQCTVDLRMPTRTIAGRALFTDGTPVVPVEVSASCKIHDGADFLEDLEFSADVQEDGSYSLEVPDWERPYRVAATVYYEEVRVDGVRAGDSGVDLVFEVHGRFLVRVIDAATRAPLRRGDVALHWRRSGEAAFREWPVTATPADPDGWFEDWLPAGRLDLRAVTVSSEHRALFLEGVQIPAAGDAPRIEFALERAMTVELALADGLEPPPEDVEIFVVEEELRDGVLLDEDGDLVEVAGLGHATMKRLLYFDDEGQAEAERMGPGRFRFLVIPPEIVVEPEIVTVEEGVPRTIEVRWRPAR